MIFLGTISAVDNTSVNNTSTAGTPFTIWSYYSRIAIVTPAATDVTFHMTVQPSETAKAGANSSTIAATTSDLGIAEQTTTQLSCPYPPGIYTILAIYATGGGIGGDCKVYGLFGGAQS